MMKNERTLSYLLSKKITKDDLTSISASGATLQTTQFATYRHELDATFDVQSD